MVVPLHAHMVVPLHARMVIPLHGCMVVPLHGRMVVPLHARMAIPLHGRMVVPLPHSRLPVGQMSEDDVALISTKTIPAVCKCLGECASHVHATPPQLFPPLPLPLPSPPSPSPPPFPPGNIKFSSLRQKSLRTLENLTTHLHGETIEEEGGRGAQEGGRGGKEVYRTALTMQRITKHLLTDSNPLPPPPRCRCANLSP